jgi:membrane protein implicated in regulation of membrane protease activity
MDIISSLSGLEKVFAVCAVIGGTLFIIRLILQFAGLQGHDVGGGADVSAMDAAHGAGGTDVHSGDSDMSFKLLSLQGITAFLLMFGLVGLAMSKQTQTGAFASIAVAAAAAVVTVWLMARFFSAMGRLQSSGNINLDRAIGVEGTVYLNIPAEGTGQVELVVQNSMKICDASSANKTPLKTGDKVKIKSVVAGKILVVEKI